MQQLDDSLGDFCGWHFEDNWWFRRCCTGSTILRIYDLVLLSLMAIVGKSHGEDLPDKYSR